MPSKVKAMRALLAKEKANKKNDTNDPILTCKTYKSNVYAHEVVIMKDGDPMTEKDYIPFLINRGLSFFQDTVIQVNEMNRLHFLDNKLQFDYLLNNIRPRKRWSKWLKPDKIDNLELVKEYFGFGNEKAKDALEVLSKENIEEIKSKLAKGGMEKNNGKYR